MDSDGNGSEPAKGHEIVVTFDPRSQGVSVKFDSSKFRTWQYVLAVLDMARRAAEDSLKFQQLQQMQQAAQEQQLSQRLLAPRSPR